MNIFIIPSWFAQKECPHAGCFFFDQTKLLSEEKPGWNVGYICIDAYGRKLSKNLRESFSGFVKLVLNKRIKTTKRSSNFYEYLIWKPALTPLNATFHDLLRYWNTCAEAAYLQFTQDFGKPDIIHAHACLPAGYPAMFLSKKYHIPYIITEHLGSFLPKQYMAYDGTPLQEVKNVYQHASVVIAVSNSLANRIKKLQLRDAVTVIPNSVDTALFSFLNEAPVEKQRPFRFLCIASMIPDKGIDILLKAFSKISGRAVLSIVGDGTEMKNLQRLSADLKISDSVHWIGYADHSSIPGFLRKCDVFVLPSRHETFGCVYAEAITCGKPIIATKCGGAEDIVTKNNGLLIPVDDVDALHKAMLYMMDHYLDYNHTEIAKAASRRFSGKTIISQLEQIYMNCSSENL